MGPRLRVACQCSMAWPNVLVPLLVAMNSRMCTSKWKLGPMRSVNHARSTWLLRWPAGMRVVLCSWPLSCVAERLGAIAGSANARPLRDAVILAVSRSLEPVVFKPKVLAKDESSSLSQYQRANSAPESSVDSGGRSATGIFTRSLYRIYVLMDWSVMHAYDGARPRITS